MFEPFFSVIVPIYKTEQYLDEAIVSIISQNIGFEEYIQLILVRNGESKESDEICEKYKRRFPDNIDYIGLERNVGPNGGRIEGLKLAKGQYVNFFDSDDRWEDGSFKSVYDYIHSVKDIDVIACRRKQFDANNSYAWLDSKFYANHVVEIDKSYQELVVAMNTCFLKKTLFQDFSLDPKLYHAEDTVFLNQIILTKGKYAVFKDAIYLYRKRSENTSLLETRVNDPRWYKDTLTEGLLPLINLSKKKYGYVHPYLQYYLAYDLNPRLNTPKTKCLSANEYSSYIGVLQSLICLIDDAIILDHNYLDLYQKMVLFQIKYGDCENIIKVEEVNEGLLSINGLKFIYLKREPVIELNILKISANNICLSGYVCMPLLIHNYRPIIVDNKGREILVRVSDNVNDKSKRYSLGKEYYSKRLFSVQFSVNDVKSFHFIVIFKDVHIPVGIRLGDYSKLSWKNNLHYSQDGYIVTFNNTIFSLEEWSFKREIRKEMEFYIDLFWKKEFSIIITRLAVKILKLLNKKETWLMLDRGLDANGNAALLFEYISQHPVAGVNVYYVIDKGSADYKKMKKLGKAIPFKSFKHKLFTLSSERIISSYTNVYVGNLTGKNNDEYKDLYKFDQIHLQHGVIASDLSSDIDVQTCNLSKIVVSSSYEKNSLLSLPYGYKEDQLLLTGLCRFDILYRMASNCKKIILIAPTWRLGIAGKFDTNDVPMYNSDFISTRFFIFYNELINDQRLISKMKKNGYAGVFLLHPMMMVQTKDFEQNECFSILESNHDYYKTITESSLLVTDYSSIAFDFAFLKRPVIYCQFDIDSFYEMHTYKKGYFDYGVHGFGPVCFDLDSTVDNIIKYIDNGCKMESVYCERVDDFFENIDDCNTERVYNELIK